ncbi:hypothetical protein BBJ28_00017784 [Nothophytophthora sp. Chile5]|nr:hypothetical protein BBJ28_00017784 [Nothophytophthora sp. Chile5]
MPLISGLRKTAAFERDREKRHDRLQRDEMPNREMRQRSTRKRRPDVTASEGSDISGDSPRTPSGDSSGDEWIAPTEISSRPALSDTQSISDQNSTRSGRSGEASVVLAEGPPFEQSQFESWDAFHSFIRNYMRQSYQINACVQVVDKVDLTFAVRVTSAQLEHNHALDKRTFAQYPSNRMSIEPGVLDTVNELRKAGAKKKSILRFIQEHSTCSSNLRDVHNLVRSLKENEKTAATSAKRLKKWMIEFSEEAGNVGRIFVDRVEEKV